MARGEKSHGAARLVRHFTDPIGLLAGRSGIAGVFLLGQCFISQLRYTRQLLALNGARTNLVEIGGKATPAKVRPNRRS